MWKDRILIVGTTTWVILLVLASVEGFSSSAPPQRRTEVGSTRQSPSKFLLGSSSSESRTSIALRVQAEQGKGFKKDDYSAAARDDVDGDVVAVEDEQMDYQETASLEVNGDSTSEKHSTVSASEKMSSFESDDVNDQQAQLDEEFMGMAIEMALSG